MDTLASADKANALEAAATKKLKMLNAQNDTPPQPAVVVPEIRRVGKNGSTVTLDDSQITEIEIGPLSSTA